MPVKSIDSLLQFSDDQVQSLAPNAAAFTAGKKLGVVTKWLTFAKSERAIWGEIKGSGKNPYYTQVDTNSLAFKCSCPSRQFPCKHAVALMLLHGTSGSGFVLEKEPAWVQEWLDGRQAKSQKSETKSAPKKTTKQSPEATIAKRLELVVAGAEELELWLLDIVRLGFLGLASRSRQDFERVAARMIDAKAPGLAGWIRSLGELDYGNAEVWQEEAIRIATRTYLLIQAIKNYDQYDPLWQTTIRNLAGWSQSSKELLADTNAEVIQDHWLIVGQHEDADDQITTQRTWLVGKNSDRVALVLNFATRFSSFESILFPGAYIQGELAFFSSIDPYRAVIKSQTAATQAFDYGFAYANTWEELHAKHVAKLKINPWANDQVFLLKECLLHQQGKLWAMIDAEDRMVMINRAFPTLKCLKWLATTGNEPVNVAVVNRNERWEPLGIFFNESYIIL